MEKLKIIRGSETRAEEVKKVLESWGAKDVRQFSCKDENHYYFVIDGKAEWVYNDEPILKYMNYEVVKLTELKPEPKFQPFQKVLVRDSTDEVWRCSIFSHKIKKDYPFYCIVTAWKYCIPYEGNEHLLRTTDSPK